jgi:hypothetical protein
LDQLEVIMDEPESWQLVTAGPGAGKSVVACQRIAYLVDDGVPPSRILLGSFTRIQRFDAWLHADCIPAFERSPLGRHLRQYFSDLFHPSKCPRCGTPGTDHDQKRCGGARWAGFAGETVQRPFIRLDVARVVTPARFRKKFVRFDVALPRRPAKGPAAMKTKNRIEIRGFVGREPETNQTNSGTSITRFSVATTERWKGRDEQTQQRTEWHRVVFFGLQAKQRV